MRNKKFLSILMVFVLLLSFVNPVLAIEDAKIKDMVSETQKFLYTKIPDPQMGTLAGEWTVLSLARSDAKVPQGYYENYFNRTEKAVADKKGVLTSNKFTEYSRLIVALTSIGKDVTNVGGYSLIEPLANFDNVIKQGINGPIWALIAYDTKGFEIPKINNATSQNTRERMIEYILNLEITDKNGVKGGWAMTGDKPDPDITAMALYAFRPYYKNNEKVKAAVDRAISVLSDQQLSSGGYMSWGNENLESTAQVVIALTSLGIDPSTDTRFIKHDSEGNKKTTLDAISTYYVPGGGFKHILEDELNPMATDQGTEGYTAYLRFKAGKPALFDMSDVKQEDSGQPSIQPITGDFKDIANHWAKDSIIKSKGYGISNKSENFLPDKAITRAEFAVAISRGFDLSAGSKDINFSDVKLEDWFAEDIKKAASNEIILGKGENKFDPNSNITREEAMTMIQRVMKVKGFDTAVKGSAKEYVMKFADGDSVSQWAIEGAAFNIENKIIIGRPSGIVPKGNITRAEAVTVVERSVGLLK